MTLLSNLLLCAPGYSGFTSYVKRVMPGIPGYRIILSSSGFAECRFDNLLPDRLPESKWLATLHRLSLTQHGVNIASALSKASAPANSIELVYSPFCDYLHELSNVPQVITCHDLTPLFIPNSRKAFLRYRYLLPMHLGRAKAIIAISRFVADQLVSFGVPSSKIEVIYNGIDSKPSPITKPATQNLLLIARHDRNKNVMKAVRAFLGFVDSNPQWAGDLIVIGRQGRETRDLKNLLLCSPNSTRVKLISGASTPQVEFLMRNSLALVSASLMEGFDYPILEAKAEGLPTLISDIPIHKELHSDSSLFFDSKLESCQFADNLRRLHADISLWTNLSKAGLQLVSQLSVKSQQIKILSLLRGFDTFR